MKDSLLAGITHDMRAPVAAIACAAQRLLDQEAARGQAAGILRACDELTGMIDSALDLAAGTPERIALLQAPCSPGQLLRGVTETAQALARRKAQLVSLTLEGPCERTVLGDAGRLRRILMNLVSNAVKYTPPGGRIDLCLRAREEDGRLALRCCVRDTGCGMDEETLAQLFTPFSRAKAVRSAGIQGTGLGLSVSQMLAQAMGGTIEVQSRPGEGSAFTLSLSLPLAPQPEGTLRGMRFLLAEDNALTADMLCELLAGCGAQAVSARDGAEAVARFSESTEGAFDAVLMDMSLPVLDGCAAAQAIRALPRADASRVAIIALTGATDPETGCRAQRSGMNARAVKPLRMETLEALLPAIREERGRFIDLCRGGE